MPASRWSACWQHGDRPSLQLRRRDGRAIGAAKVRAVLSVPLLNFAHVVSPDCGRHYVIASKSLDIRRVKLRISGQMVGHPFLALAGEGGEFLFAFGILLGAIDVEMYRILPTISKRNAMVGGDELLTIAFEWEVPAEASGELAVDFFVERHQPTWIHALRRYSELLQQREKVVVPHNEAAWDPTWCTWTAFPSSQMTADNVLANARHAREMGINTIIIDDGWFGPGLDDDGDRPLNIGDYYPDPAKFPNLPALVRDIQGLGLRALLWHAPLCVAETSQTYPAMRQYLMHYDGREYVSGNGLAQLCPANPRVRAYVCDEVERLLIDYGADGLKLDLFNCLPPGRCQSKDHAHDVEDSVQAVARTLAEIWDRVRAVRPDVLIELKQDYGNTQLAQFGTMVRAGDTAYDVDTNARRCFWTQAVAPCVHNDYLVTSVYTDPQAMALLMVRSLAAGVPTFGLDLDRIDQALRAVIAWWLGFYNRHRRMFQLPRVPQNNDLSVWQGGDSDSSWVAAIMQACHVSIPDARRVYLLNGTSRQHLHLSMTQPMRYRVVGHGRGTGDLEPWQGQLEGGMTIHLPPGALAELAVDDRADETVVCGRSQPVVSEST